MRIQLLLSLALACGLATAAAGAEVTGTVVSADDQSVTLRHDDGTEKTHQLAPGVTLRDESGVTLDPNELVNQRVQVEIDDASRVTSIEMAEAGDTGMPGAAGRTGDDPAAAPRMGTAQERGAQAGDPTAMDPTGGAEDRAAQAGDPAAPDPAGGEMARAELPDTASPVTLIALFGGALMAAAYATRAYRRR